MLIKALAAAAGNFGGGYTIDNSLRFNDNDSAYLSRTPASAGDRKTWTWSGWVKRGNVGATQNIFSIVVAGIGYSLRFETTNEIRLSFNNTASANIKTAATYTDVSGWYHIVATVDTTQATASDRINLYVNGQQVTSFSTSSYPSLNYQSLFNAAVAHNLGQAGNSSSYFDGYMAEINFIDGQALTPDDFGEINEDTGEWSPKAYEGTYGTNGFYLAFEDGAALGDDTSGNTNDWTPTNLASTDQMLDTPTNNFGVLNSLSVGDNALSFAEGNLSAVLQADGSTNHNWYSTIKLPTTGKWYWETEHTYNGQGLTFGIRQNENGNLLGSGEGVGYYNGNGNILIDGVSTAYGSAFYSAGSYIVGCYFDADTGQVGFTLNGVDQGVATTVTTGVTYYAAASNVSGGTLTIATNANFGADSSFAGNKTRQGNTDANGKGDFYYTPPTGYLALCTDNLAEPAIVDSETQFNVVTYTGNSADRNIDVGFEADFVWLKRRDSAPAHRLYDSVRGNGKALFSNLTNAEYDGVNDGVHFDYANGFNIDVGLNVESYNETGGSYVAWCWKAGGTAVTNTDGSITSQVSANVDAGFSIVSWTANTSSPNTIGHGLSQAPDVIIGKRRSIASDWNVYHSANTSAPETETIPLNLTNATTDTNTPWNDTAPTASVFTVGSTYDQNETVIAYCFHSVEGFSKFGSYVGNGSANGPFVYTGFRPAFVIVKRTDAAGYNWVMFDSARDPDNVVQYWLYPNLSSAEAAANRDDMYSNGFKIRQSGAGINASGGTYIYMAFAESPTKFSLGR